MKTDYEILSKHCEVERFHWRGKRDLPGLALAVRRSALTFSWFANDHAAMAVRFSKLFGKKSIVVVGGAEVACVPELRYGKFTESRLKQRLTVYALKRADRVLVVDESLKHDAIRNARVAGDNMSYLPTGYDPEFWMMQGKKERRVLTVAGADVPMRMKLKGLGTFVETAGLVPEVPFVIVGASGAAREHLERRAPPNLRVEGFIRQEELLSCYQGAKVYCQLSLREGLPNTLCEAMLCECVPVGTGSVPGIRSAIGRTGFYVPYGDAEATSNAVAAALDPQVNGKRARDRISHIFPLKRREEGLLHVIDELLCGRRSSKLGEGA